MIELYNALKIAGSSGECGFRCLQDAHAVFKPGGLGHLLRRAEHEQFSALEISRLH
jgi:hypothetical protein